MIDLYESMWVGCYVPSAAPPVFPIAVAASTSCKYVNSYSKMIICNSI